MADDKEGTSKGGVNMECMGGWSFLMLGFGVIVLIPGALLVTIYQDGTNKNVQIAVATTFAIAMAILLAGLILSIIWCRKSGYSETVTCNCKKVPKETDEEAGNSNDTKAKCISPKDDVESGSTTAQTNLDQASTSSLAHNTTVQSSYGMSLPPIDGGPGAQKYAMYSMTPPSDDDEEANSSEATGEDHRFQNDQQQFQYDERNRSPSDE